MARALLLRNGGDLQLRSRIGGATFLITLPAAAHQAQVPLARTVSSRTDERRRTAARDVSFRSA